MKKILKIIGIVIGVLLIAVAALFGFLTIDEYRPADVEDVEVQAGDGEILPGDELSLLTYNIGYAGYSKQENFFMDGGTKVFPDSEEEVMNNLEGIASVVCEQSPDILFIQEVDLNSKRSFGINECEYLDAETGMGSAFAYNYNVSFIPYPIPPLGRIESGIATWTELNVSSAKRISLPCPFKWPVRIGNLKRCILEERIPVRGTDKELVIINLHLEAYDDGTGKEEQTRALMQKLEEEYAKGNYVVAGGDFNQTFTPMTADDILYPDDWMPGSLDTTSIPDGFSLAVADNAPTCRSLARAYVNREESQTYIIDGFIVSDNLDVNSVQVVDTDFMYSDHNPVKLEVTIK